MGGTFAEDNWICGRVACVLVSLVGLKWGCVYFMQQFVCLGKAIVGGGMSKLVFFCVSSVFMDFFNFIQSKYG